MRTVLFLISLTALAQNPAVSIPVDVNANRHPINPHIYGVAFGTTAQLQDLNVLLNRYGGNSTSRYNWLVNGDNRGQDWYFESIGDTSAMAGERGDTFISSSRAGGAQAMITVPMIGYVATLGANRSKLAGFSQAKYGAQTGNDAQWFADAGNGVLKSTGQNIVGNNPLDADVANSSTMQQQWIQHIVGNFGLAANGGQPYYILDNEPSIWFSTHRDVAPNGLTMDQMLATMTDYASHIKAVDSGALIIGPEEWGWSGYLFSGYDQQYGGLHGWSSLPDRTNHGGQDYLPWLLSALKTDGRHLLDVFSVHYYPQGGEFSNDVSSATQLLRNKSTRSLWDPNYVDTSWIGTNVMLIPRLRNWANTYYYAGTPIAITEYNWGAEPYINGATTQADIFGIFGREGLDMATRWTTPDASTPTYKAMKMYRNYDGNKGAFGDVSVSASAPNADNIAAFAAQRASDGALTVMVISKYLSGTTPVTLPLANFSGTGTAQAYQLTGANAIARLADVAYAGSNVAVTVPAQSVTLLVIPKASGNVPPTAVASGSPASGVAPLAVTFSAAGSNDPDGSIASYGWAFGDGVTATGTSASHSYASAGNYKAVLTVTDNLGATGTATVTITVTANVLNAPSNLTASASGTTVTLNWKDNSTNETGFYIERAPSGSSTFTRAGTAGANVTTFKNSPGRGTWVYRVQAYSGATVSAYSKTASVRVK